MAETVWQAGSDGAFGLTANWTNGVPGSAPSLVGVFNGTSHTSVASGLDQGAAANTFRIRTTKEYFGNIGSSGNPLVINQSAGQLAATIRSFGDTYLSFGNSAVLNAVVIDAENGFVSLNKKSGVAAGTNPLMVKSGRVEVNGLLFGRRFVLDLTNGRVVFVDVNIPDVVEIGNGQLLIQSASAFSGTDPKCFSVRAGEVTIEAVLVTEVRLTQHGGHIIYNPGTDPSGELPDLTILGGFFDASDFAGDLTFGTVIKGRTARISENVQSSNFITYDLAKDWP